jgi:hypothetical protein
MPSFDITKFQSNIVQKGTMKTNHFEVRITPPKVLNNLDSELLSFRAESARIPGVTLDSTDNRIQGYDPRQKFATNIHFSDVSVSFIETADLAIYKTFTKWINGIFNFDSGVSVKPTYSVAYKDDYAVTVQILIYNAQNNLLSIVNLIDAFPLAVSDSRLDWSEHNQILKTNVTFAYSRIQIDSSGVNLTELDRQAQQNIANGGPF